MHTPCERRRSGGARPLPGRDGLGAVRLDPKDRSAYLDGVPVELTQKEFDLALVFLRNPGRLLSRGHLLDAVWQGKTVRTSARTVDTHVSVLRRKLRLVPESGWRISPVHNYGYRLEHARPFDKS